MCSAYASRSRGSSRMLRLTKVQSWRARTRAMTCSTASHRWQPGLVYSVTVGIRGSREMTAQEPDALLRGALWVLRVRVQLDREETVITHLVEGAPQRRPVERAFPGDHVIVLAAGDVLDVHVPDARAEQVDDVRDRFADHLAVPDVEVRTEARVAEAVDPLAQLGDVLEEQAGLALDADVDLQPLGFLKHGQDRLGELFRRALRRHAAEHPAARDADVRGADVMGELERGEDQLRAVLAVPGVRADQARLEVRLGRRVLPIAERAVRVDVADGDAQPLDFVADRTDVIRLQPRRVRVRHVREDLDAVVTGRLDAAQRLDQ